MKKIRTLWAALGVMYVAMETVFRGYSHPSMLAVGGLCGLLVGAINQHPRFYNAPVALQSAAGALIVLAVEFAAGCVLNLWLGLDVWDYSGLPGNLLGQVCPQFGVLWFFLMPLAIWAEDTGRWLIWYYELTVHGRRRPQPAQEIYSLAQVYREFFTGR